MKLVRIWDYFMRRKSLLLVAFLGLLGGMVLFNACFRSAEEPIPNIPRTGELTSECNAEQTKQEKSKYGGGANDPEEVVMNDAETFSWGEEVPDAGILLDTPSISTGEKIESLIVTIGVGAVLIVIFMAKFVFDHYVR